MSEYRRRSSQYSTTPIKTTPVVARRRSSIPRYNNEPVNLYPSRRASQIARRQKAIDRRESLTRWGKRLTALVIALTFWAFLPKWPMFPKNPLLRTHLFSSDTPSQKDSPFEIDYLRRRLPTMVNQVANMSLSASKAAPGGMLLRIIEDQANTAFLLSRRNTHTDLKKIFGAENEDNARRVFTKLTDGYRGAFVHAAAANPQLDKFNTLSKHLAVVTRKSLTNITKELSLTSKLLKSPDVYAALQNFSSRTIESLKGMQSDRDGLTERINLLISDGYLSYLDRDVEHITVAKEELRRYGGTAREYLKNKRREYEEYKKSCDMAGIFCFKNPVPKPDVFESWLLCLLSGEECELMDGTSKELTKERERLDMLINRAADQLTEMNLRLKNDLYYIESGKQAQKGWPTWYSGLSTAPLVTGALTGVKDVAYKFEKDLQTVEARGKEGEKRRNLLEISCWRNKYACLYEKFVRGKEVIRL